MTATMNRRDLGAARFDLETGRWTSDAWAEGHLVTVTGSTRRDVSRRAAAMNTKTRFPVAALLEGAETTRTELARRLRQSGETIVARSRDGLTAWQADRAAVAFGRHPAEIWPEWWTA